VSRKKKTNKQTNKQTKKKHVFFVMIDNFHAIKEAMSRFVNLEKFSLSFPISLFAIRVNLRHPYPSSFRFGLVLPPWCFSNL